MTRVMRVRYKGGVLVPEEPLDLEEGREYRAVMEEDIDELVKRYRGALGKSSIEEFRELDEETQAQLPNM